MKKSFKGLVMACFAVLIFCGVGMAKEYKLDVPKYPQERDSWCGVAVSQSLINYLAGWYRVSQQDIVKNYDGYFDGVDVGDGVNPKEVEKILEDYTGKSFSVDDHKSVSSAFNRIKEELKEQKRPLIISANACLPSGKPGRPQGHWMIVEALKLKNDNKDFDGSYVYDPLYNSSFASHYEVLRPRTWVRDLFTKWWVPNTRVSSEFRQSVED